MRLAFGPIPREFVSDTEIYDSKDPLSGAVAEIHKHGAVVVTKNGKYYGVVDDRALSGRGSTRVSQGLSIGKVAKQAPALSSDNDINSTIHAFYHSSSKVLAFMDNGKIKGVVKRTEILKAVLSMHILSEMRATDAMSVPVLAIDQETNVEHAVAIMKANRVNRLVVMDKGKPFGILTSKNVMESGVGVSNRSPAIGPDRKTHTTVGEICQRSFYTLEYNSSIDDAIRSLISKNISSLVVVRNNKPVGMLAIRDIFETIVKNANVPKRNIILSGLDEDMREYESDIRTEVEAFADKIDRFSGTRVDYIAINMKRIKQREYEMRGRTGLVRGGTVSLHTSGFTLEATLKDLLTKMFREIKDKNDVIIAGRKI